MANISATFHNTYGDSRRWVIQDTGIDPNSPVTLFDGYLAPDEATQSLSLYSSDDIYGKAQYQRSDGAPTLVDVSNGDDIRME